ncbi:MAG: putative lipoprotein [Polyangiaceae bacterium]|jgi:hypothetical protein|nr:putative lipoprotein [Polyangiaceae bacterium]
MRYHSKKTMTLLAALLCTAAVGCSGDDDAVAGKGSLTVLVEPEDTIIEGIKAGSSGEAIQDGWSVAFDRFIITIGDIDVHLSTDESADAEAEEAYTVDLTQVEESGLELWKLDGLQEGRWELHYATPGAVHGALRHESVSKADFEEMVEADFTYLIDGTLSKASGQSCPPAALASVGTREPNGQTSGGNDCYDAPQVRFHFGAGAETVYGPCELDEVPGFAITADRTESIALTIHGDHLFFNGFPEGSESGIRRLAQWLADCDLDLDGVVTREELEAITPAELPELDAERYQLGGAPIELDTMYDYAIAQLKTQGHFRGEGECAIDGEAHDHE